MRGVARRRVNAEDRGLQVVQNLDDLGSVTIRAEELGRNHATLQVDFRPEHWSVFTECILEAVSADVDREMQLAWRQLVQLLVYNIRFGAELSAGRLIAASARASTARRFESTATRKFDDAKRRAATSVPWAAVCEPPRRRLRLVFGLLAQFSRFLYKKADTRRTALFIEAKAAAKRHRICACSRLSKTCCRL